MTEATQTALPNQGVTLANVEIINHLMWGKAVKGVDDDVTRINEYINLVKEGEHVSLKDPFDRSVALAFDLVIQGQLNVWDIDLVKFSNLYLQNAQKREIDLVTAGRIILMAWTVLKRQSDDLVRKFEARQEETVGMTWDAVDPGWNMEGDEFEVTRRLRALRYPIDEKIWHEGDRPVTLMELLGAFDEARHEAEQRQMFTKIRDDYKAQLKDAAAKHFQGRVHKEDLEEDIRLIWDRICALNGSAIQLDQLYDRTDVWDLVTAFTSVLFLQRDRRVDLWQDNFPYGPVKVRNLRATGAPVMDEEGAKPHTDATPEAAPEAQSE